MTATAPMRAAASNAVAMGASIASGVAVGVARFAALTAAAGAAALAIAGIVTAWKTISFLRGAREAGMDWMNTLNRLRMGINVPAEQMPQVVAAMRALSTATGATSAQSADLAIALSRAGTSTEDLASRSRLAHRLMTSLGSDAQTTATGLESTRRAWALNNEELGAAADAIHAVQKATGQGSSVLENLNAMGERARESSLGVTGAARLLAAATEAGEGASGSAEAIGEMAARLTKAREESTKFRNGLRQLGLNANQVGDAMRVDATAGIMAFLAAVKRASDAGKDTDKILRDMFDTRQAASNVSNMASAVDRMAGSIRRASEVPAGSLTRDTDAIYRNAENSAKRAQEAWRQLQSEMGKGSAAVDTFFKELQAGLARHLADPNSGFAKWWSDQKLSFLQGLTGTRDLDVALRQVNEFWDKLKERGEATRAAFGDAGNFEGGFLATINRKAGEALAKLERILGIREMLASGLLGDRVDGPLGPYRPIKTAPAPRARPATPGLANLDDYSPEANVLLTPRERADRRRFRQLLQSGTAPVSPEDAARRARDEQFFRESRDNPYFVPQMLPPAVADAIKRAGVIRPPDFAEQAWQQLERRPLFGAPVPQPRFTDPVPTPHPLRPSAVPGADADRPRVVRTQRVTEQVMPSPPLSPLGAPATPFPEIGRAADAMQKAAASVERLMSPARTPTPQSAAQGGAAPVSRVETPVNVQSTSQVTVTVTPQIDGIEARVRAIVDQGKRDLEAAVARGQNDIRNAARGLGRLGGGSSGALGDGPRGGSN